MDAARAQHMENTATSGLIDLGNSFFARGEAEPAERYYRQALDFAQLSKGRRNEARAQMQLGALFEHSRPEEARKFLEAALPFYRQGGLRRDMIRGMVVLGGIHRELGGFDEGARILREALDNVLQLQDSQTEALVRERLGLTLDAQGRWPEALEEHQREANIQGAGPASDFARLQCASLYRRLGRPEDAERSLAEVLHLLEQRPNPKLQFEVTIERARAAYAAGLTADALAIARQALASAPRNDLAAAPKATLIEGLAMIRSGQASAGGDLAGRAIALFEQANLKLEAAFARLTYAEALLAAGNTAAADAMAREALAFFEPRHIWEAIWRVHAVTARAAADATAQTAHRNAARAAWGQMKAIWAAPAINAYLTRSDVKPLSALLEP
jgi:hypothetical protein